MNERIRDFRAQKNEATSSTILDKRRAANLPRFIHRNRSENFTTSMHGILVASLMGLAACSVGGAAFVLPMASRESASRCRHSWDGHTASARLQLLYTHQRPGKSSCNRRSTTHLNSRLRLFPMMSAMESTTFRAASSLIVASSIGQWWSGKGGDASILVTLVTAAVLSNGISFAPPVHPLYDVCWQYFLPGSLVLLLLSLPTSTNSNNQQETTQVSSTPQFTSRLSWIRNMGLPFGFASVASVVGCLVALRVSRTFHILPPAQAPMALACLLASFVGGSVNFMATARVLTTTHNTATAAPPSVTSSSWQSAMAAADLLVMALYFAFLSIAATSTRLRQWVTGEQQQQQMENPSLDSDSEVDRQQDFTTAILPGKSRKSLSLNVAKQRLQGSIVVLGVTGVLVHVANVCERFLANWIPGTACGVLALLTPVIQRYIPTYALATTSFWSEMTFLALFASVGITANVKSALAAGPGCLVASLVALCGHVGVLLTTAAVWNRLQGILSKGRFARKIELDTLLIASNAAIGGPSTAATWAGRTAPQWALAATVWGVVGYAIGTTLGVCFYRTVVGSL